MVRCDCIGKQVIAHQFRRMFKHFNSASIVEEALIEGFRKLASNPDSSHRQTLNDFSGPGAGQKIC